MCYTNRGIVYFTLLYRSAINTDKFNQYSNSIKKEKSTITITRRENNSQKKTRNATYKAVLSFLRTMLSRSEANFGSC